MEKKDFETKILISDEKLIRMEKNLDENAFIIEKLNSEKLYLQTENQNNLEKITNFEEKYFEENQNLVELQKRHKKILQYFESEVETLQNQHSQEISDLTVSFNEKCKNFERKIDMHEEQERKLRNLLQKYEEKILELQIIIENQENHLNENKLMFGESREKVNKNEEILTIQLQQIKL